MASTVGAGHRQLSSVSFLVHDAVLRLLEVLPTKSTEEPRKFVVVVDILNLHVTLLVELPHVTVVEYHSAVLAVDPVWILELHR